ncbi:MAG TPA: hypothetical protein VFT66_24020 [Roseiflexaceae bacterium]|nr:hypothetical protein [Roseiflexaceae bacterium]
MQFLVWYDDNAKTLVVDKIQAAIAAYVARFQLHPSLVLVNVADHIEMSNVTVLPRPNISPNTFWIGREDSADRAIA